ncbi:MAG: class I SAM-dependent methyltransferase [Spirochaetales bacterium]|nr:class I SAM-dependent methyltransferase [Spirochaetales bacterium]MCF7949414.1 class I SAM-dependent methyltransferase [Spirochaetia bacterium]MCF7951596.1 class I SAM-dependent methyltransferase [Spirochaetaceae bacterium]
MTEIELLIDFHKDAERQGPGSTADTLKALSFIDLPRGKPLKVADIGCGTGAQTLTLARQIAGHITAVDLFPEFLDQLNRRAQELGVQNKITTLQKSMDDLSFSTKEFDIIWSEGAIYIMGFAAGIHQWKPFLKPGGYLAVSEITWLTNTRPAEIEAHWNREYPEIDTAAGKMKVLEEQGFSPVGYFILPPASWIENYYRPMEARFEAFLERHKHSEPAKTQVEADRDEIEKYKRFKDYFGYGFYVAKKMPGV